MANAKDIKRKITSIKNTWKITKAMEIISTIKMKKAQNLALEKKDYVFEMLKIFIKTEEYLKDFPIFKKWNWDKTLAVIITSNKWLCWGYNVNVMKKVNSYIKETWENLDFISVWKRWALFVAKTWNELVADFSTHFSEVLEPIFIKIISKVYRREYMSWKYNKVVVFYNHFVNTIKQVAVAEVVLPISADDIKSYLMHIIEDNIDFSNEIQNGEKNNFYELEPSPENLAEEVIPIILDLMFYELIIESKASEHSSRMIAMKNAKDSAKKIANTLTLKYNKARQANITKEVSEIVSWVESLKE